ncbi:hypothetical protein [Marinobacter salexigens]|uniref:hypothetical protein n=1 Tax=Marinobacter salexigens TaxID=1925763 RepID=UPI000C283636|nr:hypothetical protein [Marinobacter salexigens]
MIHLQIAEAGKQHSLKGNHPAALERYRHALQLAVKQRANPVFLYHYTECILDALEAAGEARQALALTERALEEQQEKGGELGSRVRAGLLQRRIVLLFTLEQKQEADAALAEAAGLGGPILNALQDARRRQLTITPSWLSGILRQHSKSIINPEALRHADAEAGEVHFMKENACAGS